MHKRPSLPTICKTCPSTNDTNYSNPEKINSKQTNLQHLCKAINLKTCGKK